jgi:ABC-type transport system involved in multi-copper enzyme maturation permease subunit
MSAPSWVDRLRDPNPVLARELRTTIRAPSFLAVIFLSAAAVAAVTLFAATSLGSDRLPFEAGATLLEWYFGASTVLVSLVSSVYAAGAVSRDAEAGVVDALAVAGFSPWRTLGGKLLALWGVSCLLLVAASPASIVPVILGGTVPGAILVGHLYLAIVSLWSIAFGLAVSTRLGGTRSSTIVAVAVALPASAALLGASSMHGEWARVHWGVPATGPFWPATAVALGLGPARVVFLLVLPLLTTAGALWYLAATAVGPLLPPSEDRGRGARLWIPLASALLLLGVVIGRVLLETTPGRDYVLVAMGAELAVAVIAALTIMGEPLDPPLLRRSVLFGPGIGPASTLIALTGAATVGALVIAMHTIGVAPWPAEASAPMAAAMAAWITCIASLGYALRRLLPSVTVARIVLGSLALGIAVALPQTSIYEAARWTPWFVLRNANTTPWEASVAPLIVAAAARALAAIVSSVRAARRSEP